MVRWNEIGLSISSTASIIVQRNPKLQTFYRFYKLYWKCMFTIIWPLILISVFIISTDIKFRCLYVMLLMYGFWITNCIPEGITSIIPVFALPLLKIQNVHVTCRLYFQYGLYCIIALFIAIVLESSRIPERIVFWLGLKFGGTPRALHAAITLVSFVISIRFVNAYAINIMIPIVTKILISFKVDEFKEADVKFAVVKLKHDTEERPLNMSMACYCGIIYCAAFGGINFVSGTASNLTFTAVYQCRFPNCRVHQTPWYFYTMPTAIISFVSTTLWLQLIFLGLWTRNKKSLSRYNLLKELFVNQKVVKNLYEGLEKLKYRHICIIVSFLIYLGFWYLDELFYFLNINDLSVIMLFINSSVPFLMITFTLMVMPATGKMFHSFSRNKDKRPRIKNRSLISWETLITNIAFGRVLTVGAGITLGYAETSSGLAKYLAEQLVPLKDCNFWLLLGLTTLSGQLLTEICNNVVTCAIFSPILIEFCVMIKIAPVSLCVPFVCTCSMGFLSPVASPNVKKLVTQVDLPLKYLIVGGIFPKLITWISLFVTYEPYGKIFLNENTVQPKNFTATNVTCFCEPCYNVALDKYSW